MSLDNLRQIKIGEKWSYGDFGLLLGSGWSLSAPVPKTTYVDVPESDGQLDLSEALTGEVHYQPYSLSATLILQEDTQQNWEINRRKFFNYVHGKRLKLTLPDAPDYYLLGRFSVSGFKFDYPFATIDVTAVLDPWYYKNNLTNYSFSVIGTKSITLNNERKTAIPTVTTDAAITITQGAKTVSISAGTYSLADMPLLEGNNTYQVTSTILANVTFSYQEASL